MRIEHITMRCLINSNCKKANLWEKSRDWMNSKIFFLTFHLTPRI